jgi:hypothetical protein
LQPKDLYAEICPTLRHYLGWRERLLVGYVAVIAGLAVAFAWMDTKYPLRSWFIPLVAAFVSVAFRFLDRRNRDIYRAVMHAGAALEADAPQPDALPLGVYTAMLRKPKPETLRLCPPSHSVVLDVVFFGAALGFLGIALYLLCRR